jgi:hypothetical protein
MDYYYKYIKYRNKYLNLKELVGRGEVVEESIKPSESMEEITVKETIKFGDNTYQIFNKDLGEGVDGIIYLAKKGDTTLVAKIMNYKTLEELDTPKKLEDFKRMNKFADEKDFGPKIYDIEIKDDKLYLFMEDLDTTLTNWIAAKVSRGEEWNGIIDQVKDIVFPIHYKMMKNNVSIGDDNTDNYMNKGDKWYRIDYNKNEFKKNSEEDYKKFFLFHPVTHKRISITDTKYIN